MRVLVIAPHPFFEERGTPIAVRAVLESLSELGHELHVLTYHIGQEVQIPNCHVHRIPRIPGVADVPPGLSFKKLLCDAVLSAKSLKLVREMDFDLVVGFLLPVTRGWLPGGITVHIGGGKFRFELAELVDETAFGLLYCNNSRRQ